ncbi:hypothetical protein Esti_002309 [Eimeria stiedai]
MKSVCSGGSVSPVSHTVHFSPSGDAGPRSSRANDYFNAAAAAPMTSFNLTRIQSVEVLRSRLKSIAGLSSALQKQYALVAPASAAAAAAAAASASRRNSASVIRPLHLERPESVFFVRGATGNVLASFNRFERPSFSSFPTFKLGKVFAGISEISPIDAAPRINSIAPSRRSPSVRSSKQEVPKPINRMSPQNSGELFDRMDAERPGTDGAEAQHTGAPYKENVEKEQEGTSKDKSDLFSPRFSPQEAQPIFESVDTWDSEKILACIRTLRPHGRAMFNEARKRLLREMQQKIYERFEPLKSELDRRGVFDEQTNALRVRAKLRCRAYDAAQQLRHTFNELALKGKLLFSLN